MINGFRTFFRLAAVAHMNRCCRLWSLTVLLMAGLLLLNSCAAGPPANVAGNYSGYVGVQTEDNKVGLKSTIEQNGDILTGTVTAEVTTKTAVQKSEGSISGIVKGNNVEMDMRFSEGGFTLSMKGEFTDKGDQGPRIFGTSKIESNGKTSEGRPWVLKKTR